MRCVLYVGANCYLDDSNGATVAGRMMLEALARRGFSVEALTGTVLELGQEIDPAAWLEQRRFEFEAIGGEAWSVDARGLTADVPPHYRLAVRGVPVTLHHGTSTRLHKPDAAEREEFLTLFEAALDRFRPDVLANFGGDPLAHEVRSRARARGIPVVFPLHNFNYHNADPFATADAVLIPSRFAADHYRKTLGLECQVLPNLIDPERVRAERDDPRFVTFVNPSYEKGVYAFARIADELGRRRPDIPLLVVEARGTERTLADCGLDLRARGNVNLLGHTHDPREFWSVTRVCLMPSLWWESMGLVAVEAMMNGIPVIGSNRGALPETLGAAGTTLPLPGRLTPATRELPTAEEVAPWVEAVIRLWDDPEFYREHSRRARDEARRWEPEVLAPQYVQFFNEVRPAASPPVTPRPPRPPVVLVPHLNGIEWECEQALRQLEQAGVQVVRRGGCSAIDSARCQMVSDALHDGHEVMMFIDSDIGFDPQDALRLIARPEPVVAGVYSKKGRKEVTTHFGAGVKQVIFGPDAPGLYPAKYVATGFLRIRAEVLRRMIAELPLPLCNTHWGRGIWPFFLPLLVPHEGDKLHYLGEDWAFSHRLGQIGVVPLADTSFRLWHWGRYAYSWEEAGSEMPRYRSYHYNIGGRDAPDA